MLNTLFITSWYPKRVAPSNGSFVKRHAEAVSLFANVYLLHVGIDNSLLKNYEIINEEINGVFSVIIYYRTGKFFIPFLSKINRRYKYLKAHFIGYNYIRKQYGKMDIVHLNVLFPSGIIAVILKYFKNIPYVITEHWTGYLMKNKFSIKTNFQTFISKIIIKNASVVMPVSKSLKSAMINKGFRGNYNVVYNVVNTSLFKINNISRQKNKIKFLHISTLDDKQKNIFGILRTIKKLSEINSNFEFSIIGKGDIDKYTDYAEELEVLNTFVFFEGTKTTNEVAELMALNDCFVLFSNYETFGCVIIEAMASGLPLISTTVGGITEHITDDFGILLKPSDEENLLVAMIDMMRKVNSYDRIKISEYARNNFSYEIIGNQILQIYNDVLSEKYNLKNVSEMIVNS